MENKTYFQQAGYNFLKSSYTNEPKQLLFIQHINRATQHEHLIQDPVCWRCQIYRSFPSACHTQLLGSTFLFIKAWDHLYLWLMRVNIRVYCGPHKIITNIAGCSRVELKNAIYISEASANVMYQIIL